MSAPERMSVKTFVQELGDLIRVGLIEKAQREYEIQAAPPSDEVRRLRLDVLDAAYKPHAGDGSAEE